MYEEITIGKGDPLNSAVRCYECQIANLSNNLVYISENRNCYWISDLIFDVRMKVFKDTTEGKRIAKLLKNPNKVSDPVLRDYLERLVIKHLPHSSLMRGILELQKEAFEEGKKAKIDEIKEVLNIDTQF